MQIMFVVIVFIAILAYIIYKINKKFGTKEFIILFVTIIISTLVTVLLLRNAEEKVPNEFKTKYETEKKAKILKFSYERLNNKTLSSKTDFIYNFDYIISKEDKELICTLKNVKVKKIENEFIFENFDKLEENCQNK